MGLDNGFYIRSRKYKLTRKNLPTDFDYPWDETFDKEYGIEICYWRKYWGLRNEVIYSIEWSKVNEGIYGFVIDNPIEVENLINIIASWMDKGRWESEGRSVFTYYEALPNLIRSIDNLSIAYNMMKQRPDIYLEFYDSY